MGQMIKGLAEMQDRSNLIASCLPEDEQTGERVGTAVLEETLASMKWHVWHGNVERALERADELVDDLETWPPASDKVAKLKKAVHEFAGYIAANQASIPNYGDRRRHGERIASSFVESAVNQVVSKRMVKKQQMVRHEVARRNERMSTLSVVLSCVPGTG